MRPDNIDYGWLIYDGECPFCTRYSRYLRLKEHVKHLELISAREDHPKVKEAIEKGYDLNEGMIFMTEDHIYHGEEALHILACLSARSGFFNQLNYWLFRYHSVAKLAYPVLRAGRNLTLKILGKSTI